MSHLLKGAQKLISHTHTLPSGKVIERDNAATLMVVRDALNQVRSRPGLLTDQEAETPSRDAQGTWLE
jgi:hypothetical protein